MDYYSSLSTVGYQRPSYWHNHGSEPLLYLTIGKLLDWAVTQYGDREAVVSYEDIRWTFKEVKEKTDELAAGLLSLGLVPGDMIALWGYNSTKHYLTALAAARAGLILAKIDPQNQAPELLHCLKKVGAKLLIAAETDQSQGYYQIVHSLAPELDNCEPGKLCSKKLPELTTLVITGDQPRPGAYLFDDVIKRATPEGITRIHQLQDSIQPDDYAFIHYTSGTTGQPKAALWSHHAAVNSAKVVRLNLNPENKPLKTLAVMQCCHIGTSLFVVLGNLHMGGTAVFPSPKFDANVSIKALSEEKCEIIFATPAMYVDMITIVQERNLFMAYPKQAFITGTTISEVLARQVVKVLPVDRFVPVYGLTEGAPLCTPDFQDTVEQCVQTVGKVVPHYEVKVVDKEGKMVPMGAPGELWARGYNVTKGYWGDEQKTKETITKDGWLKTGDQAVLTDDGHCKIVGRIKEAIIRGSDNIFPKEVEEFFQTHPDVLDVQAFGVPDARLTEEVCVFIRPKEGRSLDEQQMKAFCKGKVAEFRIPRYIRFIDKFPLNMVGKVDKKIMRDSFLQDKEYLETNESNMKKFLGQSAR